VLYHAQIHPEQYSNSIKDEQIKALHSAINYVCATSVDLLANSSQFPTDWLFHYRWNKGKKDGPKNLPNGDEIHFLTVGGRTSAVVPSVQLKTGPVSKGIGDDEEAKGENGEKPKPAPKRGGAKKEPAEPKNEVTKTPVVKKTPGLNPAAKPTPAVEEAEAEAEVAAAPKTAGRKRKSTEKEPAVKPVKAVKKAKAVVAPKAKTKAEPATGVRRGRSAAKA
jgi:formamidopyrimidine-DNA glycosylase